jgi:hypothetical protein
VQEFVMMSDSVLDEEMLNWTQLNAFIMKNAAAALRHRFQAEWHASSGQTWTNSPKDSEALVAKFKQLLHEHEHEPLHQQPAFKTGDVSQFDVTILGRLLLLLVPRGKVANACHTIRKIRNKLAHAIEPRVNAADRKGHDRELERAVGALEAAACHKQVKQAKPTKEAVPAKPSESQVKQAQQAKPAAHIEQAKEVKPVVQGKLSQPVEPLQVKLAKTDFYFRERAPREYLTCAADIGAPHFPTLPAPPSVSAPWWVVVLVAVLCCTVVFLAAVIVGGLLWHIGNCDASRWELWRVRSSMCSHWSMQMLNAFSNQLRHILRGLLVDAL